MKKHLAVLLSVAAVLSFTVTGCGGYSTVTADPATVKSEQKDETEAAAPETSEGQEAEAAQAVAADSETGRGLRYFGFNE